VSELRVWIALSSAVFFLAGVAVGVLAAHHYESPSRPSRLMEGYEQRMIREFELDDVRAEVLRRELEDYVREVENLKARSAASLREQAAEIGQRYYETVRNQIIPPRLRQRFDQLTDGRIYVDFRG